MKLPFAVLVFVARAMAGVAANAATTETYTYSQVECIASSVGARIRIVTLSRVSDAEISTRSLVELSSGQRWILEQQFSPQTEVVELRLVEDATGWWFALRQTIVGKLLDDCAYNLVASVEGFVAPTYSSVLLNRNAVEDFKAHLEGSRAVAPLLQGMPASTRWAIPQLQSLLGCHYEALTYELFLPLLETLGALVRKGPALEAAPVSWTVAAESSGLVEQLSGSAAEFMGKFRRLPPLSGE